MSVGGTATSLRAAARALHKAGLSVAADHLHVAADHIANLEHAFRGRAALVESMRQRIEVLEGQVRLLTHHIVAGGRE